MLMLEIAGGVTLGGIALYVLYVFRDEAIRVFAVIWWGSIAMAGLALAFETCVGFWRIGKRILGIPMPKPSIPEGIASWAVLILIVLVAREIDGKFQNSREIIRSLKRQ